MIALALLIWILRENIIIVKVLLLIFALTVADVRMRTQKHPLADKNILFKRRVAVRCVIRLVVVGINFLLRRRVRLIILTCMVCCGPIVIVDRVSRQVRLRWELRLVRCGNVRKICYRHLVLLLRVIVRWMVVTRRICSRSWILKQLTYLRLLRREKIYSRKSLQRNRRRNLKNKHCFVLCRNIGYTG